jgi:TfoX/Sxy family transcriptional regulator of competence genes
MKLEKPTEAVTERFLAAVPEEVKVRPMFGCKAGFVNGNMIGGTWANSVMLRLGPEHAAEARQLGAKVFDPLGERPMKDYLLLPEALVAEPEGMRCWVGRAVAFTGMLPPKTQKPQRKPQRAQRAQRKKS